MKGTDSSCYKSPGGEYVEEISEQKDLEMCSVIMVLFIKQKSVYIGFIFHIDASGWY